MMRKINEIFYSLQGEGYHTGTPAVFIRFSGCNLKCSFCDTQHEAGTLMTDDEIIAEVSKYPVTVILTGGEPSLWIDDALIDRLHEAGKYVCIETNGTRPLPESVDWVTCSPKQGVKLGITRMDEVKVVYEGQDISIFELLPAEHFFLQHPLFQPKMMVKPGLGSPAEMQCGGHIFFAPVHDLHQLLPVIHFLKLHLLHRRSGDDKPVIVMDLNLVKGYIKFVQMAG